MIRFRRHTSPWTWVGLIAAFLVAFLVWQFITFQLAMNKMPRGWTISGADVTGLTYQQAIEQVGQTLTQQSVQLSYRDQKIPLQPADIGLTFNPTKTLELITLARSATGDAEGFLTYIIQRSPPPQDIAADIKWSGDKLRAYLAQVADQHDLRPQESTPILDGLRMAPGRSGHELDISASLPDVTAAIMSADVSKRAADLKVKTVPPPPPKLTALNDLIKASLRNSRGIAGVFIKDLAGGEEYGYNDEVAFSGIGILKVAVMAEVYQKHINVPPEDAKLIEQMITIETGNGAANALLQKLGAGDAYAGAKDQVMPAMKYLGLVNTFMVTPYDQNVTPPAVVTPANSRPDISTIPDPKMQTTPRDVGLLLEMIYDCSRGDGAFLVAYPNSFTPEECNQMLGVMERVALKDQSGAPAYLRGGLPDSARLAHKYSWSDKVRADVGIVFSAGRDYVIVVFLYASEGGEWQAVNPIFKDISRAAYNFFNAGQ